MTPDEYRARLAEVESEPVAKLKAGRPPRPSREVGGQLQLKCYRCKAWKDAGTGFYRSAKTDSPFKFQRDCKACQAYVRSPRPGGQSPCRAGHPCEFGGVAYPSLSAAAKANGVTVAAIVRTMRDAAGSKPESYRPADSEKTEAA